MKENPFIPGIPMTIAFTRYHKLKVCRSFRRHNEINTQDLNQCGSHLAESYLLPGLGFSGNIVNLLIVAVIFGLVNALIRPIVKLLTLPINVATLGLFTLVINALMLIITVWLSGTLTLEGGILEKFVTAFIAAIIISLVSLVLSWFLPDK